MKKNEVVKMLRYMRCWYLKKGCSFDQFDAALAELLNEDRADEALCYYPQLDMNVPEFLAPYGWWRPLQKKKNEECAVEQTDSR